MSRSFSCKFVSAFYLYFFQLSSKLSRDSLVWTQFLNFFSMGQFSLFLTWLKYSFFLSYQNQQENEVFQLIEHLRKAFRVEPSKHLLLYEKASERGRPQLKLNLCVLEAKELACKDNLANDDTASKGDPFVTVHLISRHILLDVQCI